MFFFYFIISVLEKETLSSFHNFILFLKKCIYCIFLQNFNRA